MGLNDSEEAKLEWILSVINVAIEACKVWESDHTASDQSKMVAEVTKGRLLRLESELSGESN